MKTTKSGPLLLHVFSTCEAGGAQLRTGELTRALGDDLRHVFVSLDGGRTNPRDLPGGAALHATEALPKAGSLLTAWRLHDVFARREPALVLTYDWGALDGVVANAFGRRAPLVHHEDGFTADESAGFKRRRIWARRVALRWTTRVVVPSRGLEMLARERWRVPEGKLVRIPNGVDTARFAEGPARDLRERLGLPAGTPLVGTVARLSPIKNVARLLAAFARLRMVPAPHLLVAGEGPEREALERLAVGLGIETRVRWLGFLREPAELLRELDVFALSSDREELPRALLEAMACARPVVSTRVGDVPEVLPAIQAPYLVPLGGERVTVALTEALERLLREPDDRAALGRANRARVAEEYGAAAMHARYRELYRGLLPQDREA